MERDCCGEHSAGLLLCTLNFKNNTCQVDDPCKIMCSIATNQPTGCCSYKNSDSCEIMISVSSTNKTIATFSNSEVSSCQAEISSQFPKM